MRLARATAPCFALLAAASCAVCADVTLVGAGDIATCHGAGDEATARLLDGIEGTVFTAGDNVYPDGSAAAYERCYGPSWGRHRGRTRPAPGNHDHRTPEAQGYFAYFGERAGEPGRGYYAYSLGAWQILVLDSNAGVYADPAQLRWLHETLERSEARCALAYWHHPLFSSGRHGDNDHVRRFWGALSAHGAEIVIGGHDHDYERFAAQTPAGAADPQRGIVQFVVGTGGARLQRFWRVKPNSAVRFNEAHGVLRLDLGTDGYRWELLRADGGPSPDSGSGRCHD